VSTIAVIGGSGDYLCVADRVVQMREYCALDVTPRARAIVLTTNAAASVVSDSTPIHFDNGGRVPLRGCCTAVVRGKTKIRAPQPALIQFGDEEIELGDCEQIPDKHVAYTIGWCLAHLSESLGQTPPRLFFPSPFFSDTFLFLHRPRRDNRAAGRHSESGI
jgi:predicted ABC-class ATPase